MKACAKGNDVITNVISTNQHFASTFSMHIFKFQRRSCNLSFLFLPHHQSFLERWLAGYQKCKDLTVTCCETVSYNLFERFQLHVQLYVVQLGRLFLPQLKLHMQSSFQNAKIFDCIGQTSNVPVTCKSPLVQVGPSLNNSEI